MANHGYMKITGAKQKLISEGCSTQASIGNKCQASHADEVMVLAYSHTMANIGNIKKATHSPIIITKFVDKSSPLLAQALASQEELTCVIDLYRVASSTQHSKFFTVEITGGLLVDLTLDIPHALTHHDAEPQELLALRYRDIRWTHHTAGTTGYSFWSSDE